MKLTNFGVLVSHVAAVRIQRDTSDLVTLIPTQLKQGPAELLTALSGQAANIIEHTLVTKPYLTLLSKYVSNYSL